MVVYGWRFCVCVSSSVHVVCYTHHSGMCVCVCVRACVCVTFLPLWDLSFFPVPEQGQWSEYTSLECPEKPVIMFEFRNSNLLVLLVLLLNFAQQT